jgi:uncharacterized membrane protein YfcA
LFQGEDPDVDLSLFQIALIVLAAFGTAVFHAVGGFAGALMLAICLAPILGVKETVPVVATAMIISNISRIWAFRQAVDWRAFAAVFGTALPCIVISAIVYVSLPVAAVALLLGVFLVISVPLRRAMARHAFKVCRRGLAAAAVPYGLISGSTFGAGMMLAPFLLGAGLAGEQLVATVAALGLGLNITKTAVFGISPLLDQALFIKGVLIGLCTIPGAYAGRWIVRRTPIRVHTLYMEGLVLCGAAYFLWQAAAGFGWL